MSVNIYWVARAVQSPRFPFSNFGSILSEYSVIRRIWACHGRGSINGRGHKLNIYLKKK